MLMAGFRVFTETFKHQCKLAWVNKFSIFNSLMFYLICLTLFHIAIGPYALSESVRIALLFTPLPLAMMLNSNSLIQDDFREGILHQLILTPTAYEFILLGKISAYISTYIAALLIAFPIASFVLGIDFQNIPYLITTGCILVVFTSAVLLLSSTMTISNNFNILLPILVLPFLIPALIFATLAYQSSAYLWLLIASTLLIFPVFIFFSRHLIITLIKYD
jgi:heme exporter protein CcmB